MERRRRRIARHRTWIDTHAYDKRKSSIFLDDDEFGQSDARIAIWRLKLNGVGGVRIVRNDFKKNYVKY